MDAKTLKVLRPEDLGIDIPDLRGENPSPDTEVSLLTTNNETKVYGFEHAKMELEFILSEIMTDNEYFRHGIDVPAGSVVVDVGANIGLFGVAALAKAPNGDATYIGIEPVPMTVQALRLNLLGTDHQGKDSFFALNSNTNSNYSQVLSAGAAAATAGAHAGTTLGPPANLSESSCQTNTTPATATAVQAPAAGEKGSEMCHRVSAAYPNNITIITAAVSDVSKGAAEMTFYPYMPGNSTLRTKEKEMLQLEMLAPYFEDSQQVTVPVITLHDIIQQQGLAHIHLLKVDVEGEELAVLKGLSDTDWSKIDAVVMEIHDCIDQPSGKSMFDLEGDRGGGIDSSRIRFHDDLGALSVGAAKRAEAVGGLLPPLTNGRVMAAAQLLRDKGFRVVLECSLGIPVNYNAYAVKS